MRLLWAAQYRLYLWLKQHIRAPRDVEDYLAAFPGARYALQVLTLDMQKAFGLSPVRPILYRDPECGSLELTLVAYVSEQTPYMEADRMLDKAHSLMLGHADWWQLSRHINLRFEWMPDKETP